MPLKIESRHLGEIVVVVPQVFGDDRGYFMETYRSEKDRKAQTLAEWFGSADAPTLAYAGQSVLF